MQATICLKALRNLNMQYPRHTKKGKFLNSIITNEYDVTPEGPTWIFHLPQKHVYFTSEKHMGNVIKSFSKDTECIVAICFNVQKLITY